MAKVVGNGDSHSKSIGNSHSRSKSNDGESEG